MKTGTLLLIPNALGPGPIDAVLPASALAAAARLTDFVGESAKATRALLARVRDVRPLATPLQDVRIAELDVKTPASAWPALLAPLRDGRDMGLVSDAGCPGIADPGAALVRLAHREGIAVRPLTGPSSIVLALMASGLDGQRFAFHGYPPVDAGERIAALREHERHSRKLQQTQVFIETPYRNRALLDALGRSLDAATLVCVARDLTLESEWIATRPSRDWARDVPDLDRRPTVFLFLAR